MALRKPHPDADELADLIESLGAAVAAEFSRIEAELIAAIAAELRAGRIDDAGARIRLGQLGNHYADILNGSEIASQVVFVASSTAAGVAASRILGRTVPPYIPAAAVTENAALVVEMTANLDAMRARIKAYPVDAYTTASSYMTLTDQHQGIVNRYLAQGITGKVYRNGARFPIGSYAEMVARTITNQAASVAEVLAVNEHGSGFAEIIIGSDACSSCAANAGRIYSTDGTPAGPVVRRSALGGGETTFYCHGPLAVASSGKSHFRGPNCRCRIVNYSPGTMPDGGTTYSPEREQARDRQREIERRIREWKMRSAAAIDDGTKRAANAKVREWQSTMRDHIGQTGRVRASYREQLTFGTGATRPFIPAPVPVT